MQPSECIKTNATKYKEDSAESARKVLRDRASRKRVSTEEKSAPPTDEIEDETEQDKRTRLLRERAERQRSRKAQEEEEQVLLVSVERFTVPEVLFRPQDAGMQSQIVGLAVAVMQAVEACPEPYHPALYRSIFITGGVAKIPNLK